MTIQAFSGVENDQVLTMVRCSCVRLLVVLVAVAGFAQAQTAATEPPSGHLKPAMDEPTVFARDLRHNIVNMPRSFGPGTLRIAQAQSRSTESKVATPDEQSEASFWAQVLGWLERSARAYQTTIVPGLSAPGRDLRVSDWSLQWVLDHVREWLAQAVRDYETIIVRRLTRPTEDGSRAIAETRTMERPPQTVKSPQPTQQETAPAARPPRAGAEAPKEAVPSNAIREADTAPKKAELKRVEEARQAEEVRRQAEARRTEAVRQAEAARQAEGVRKAEDARRAEEARRVADAGQARIPHQLDQASIDAAYKSAEEALTTARAKLAEEARAAAEAKREAENRAAEVASSLPRAVETKPDLAAALRKAPQPESVADAKPEKPANREAGPFSKLALSGPAGRPGHLRPAAPVRVSADPAHASRTGAGRIRKAKQATPNRAQNLVRHERPTGARRLAMTRRAPSKTGRKHCPSAGKRMKPPPTYIVRRGDTLWGIAERQYGAGWHYPRIFQANRSKIANPDLIFPRQRLIVPRATS